MKSGNETAQSLIAELSLAFQSSGYSVNSDYSFASGYSVDIVATGRNCSLIIEVKNKSRLNNSDVMQVIAYQTMAERELSRKVTAYLLGLNSQFDNVTKEYAKITGIKMITGDSDAILQRILSEINGN